MPELQNFLSPDIGQIKHSIKGIDDSYNNQWDILAELLQNAVDAIRSRNQQLPADNEIEENTYKGSIQITVDSIQKLITVNDNGIGIDPSRLPALLKPFSSSKNKDPRTIGEKGVGLTFALFSCDDFHIKSSTGNSAAEASVQNAYKWKNDFDDPTELNLTYSDIDPNFEGTMVTLKSVQNCQLFELNVDQLIYTIRTKTSVGNTRFIWSEDIDIDVSLKFINQDGVEYIKTIPFKYQLPTEILSASDQISLEEFRAFMDEQDRTDAEKRRKLQNKVITLKGSYLHNNNRQLHYWACFVSKRNIFTTLSKLMKVLPEDKIDDEEYIQKFEYCLCKDGIQTAIKGMPTGISVSHPSSGYSGYWSNIFMIIEDDALSFDIGRKSINGPQANIIKKCAKEKVFNEFLKFVTKYVSGEIDNHDFWSKDTAFSQIDSILDMRSPDTRFSKSPKDQEASVAAIFYEQLGRGKFENIIPLVSGYKNRYDLYAKYKGTKIVAEFKTKPKNILKDFSDETKLFSEVDLLICWDVNEDDKEAFQNKGITMEEIQSSMLGGISQEFIEEATHRLSLSGMARPIYIIALHKSIS